MSAVATIQALAGAAGLRISRLPCGRRIGAAEPLNKIDFCEIADDVLRFFDKVPYFYGDDVRPELSIAGAWRGDLLERRKNQIEAIAKRDREKLASMYDQMFFNELCTGLQIYNYFDGSARAHPEFELSCERFQFLTGQDAADYATPRNIRMWGSAVNGGGVLQYTNPNHAMQAITVSRLLTMPIPSVLDIGSGFGGMAEKLAKAYVGPTDIWLLDIPANLTTAYAYLAAMFGRHAVTLFSDPAQIRGIPANAGERRFLLAPSCFVDDLPKTFDVVHNNGSFSEMDIDTVNYYIASTVTPSVAYFIETNSNIPTTNTDGHSEVMNSTFRIPKSHKLLSRYMPFDTTPQNNRYMTNIYGRA